MLDTLKRHRWDLALVDDEWNFHFIRIPYRDRWFADPFILDVTEDEIVLLVEEYSYVLKRGRIARLSICRKTLELKNMEIVLDLPTHLSFPAILRKDGQVFVYPENSESGMCSLYNYNDKLRKMTMESVLSKEPLTDAVITGIGGGDLMLSTRLPEQNGKQLGIYKRVDGEYKLAQTIVFDDYVGRNAGDTFIRGGVVYRPAQICDGSYGYGLGISFQALDVKDGQLQAREVFRRFPPKGYDGMHTYNSYKGIHVVDCRRYLYPVIRNVLHAIKHAFCK